MKVVAFSEGRYPALSIACILFLAGLVLHAQVQNPPAEQSPRQAGTIRVNVGLVQTDVMVFDRQGRFVPDLKMNEFELRVDGKVQPIEFIETVSAGSDQGRCPSRGSVFRYPIQ